MLLGEGHLNVGLAIICKLLDSLGKTRLLVGAEN